ncbi:hypothetical protein MPDQ_001028 [Monascus purpureus]|uniref:YCII-related domain-containing protein n=1 Tax=Monascus purpureus TaxID=5098 RepID=A0A507QNK4_MONPU|nr:hypothetical protein MPDQ_001028 [Monascus purpureus]
MATVPKKKEFLFIIPDKPNSLELRKKVRSLQSNSMHLETARTLAAAGKLLEGVEITFAGALFEKHPEEGQDPQFKGSMIVCPGENVEEALEIIKNDIYATTGVWDVEKAQIYPYVPAVRL